MQQRLVELGWPTELLFLPLLLGGLACVAGTEIGRRVRCRSMRRLYTACALLCGVGTLLVGAAPAWGGILGMMLVQGVLEVYLLHESQKLNDAIPSDQRATLISVDGMAYSLLMIPASPLVGAVGDAFGQAGAGLALLGGVIVLSGVALLGKSRRNPDTAKSGCVPVGAHPLCYFAQNRRQVSGIKNTSMGKISRRPASMSKIITSLAGLE